MKKLIILSILLGFATAAVALPIINQNVKKQVSTEIVGFNRDCTNAATKIGSRITKTQDIITSNSDEFDQTDKDKFAAYKALLNTAKTALDAVVAYKENDAEWSQIE